NYRITLQSFPTRRSSELAPVAPAAPQQEQAAQSTPTAQPAAPAVPLAIPMEPRPVMVNSERSEITYTFTELRDMADESQQIGEPDRKSTRLNSSHVSISY